MIAMREHSSLRAEFAGIFRRGLRGNISVVVAEIQEASAMRIVPPPASSSPLRSAVISSAFCCHSLSSTSAPSLK